MPYTLSQDHARMDLNAIWNWLRRSYWSPDVRCDVVERAMRNSMVIGAFDESGRQVAYARVITDRATFAYLCDVIVDDAHRGKGVSKQMVEALLAHPDLQTVRRWSLGTRDAHGLYARYGFKAPPPDRWMEKVNDPSVWREAGTP
ncbi:MAG: GNAT family N-acetyltransferase [Phycisphaerales bacterium]